jgi:hypothetical protein
MDELRSEIRSAFEKEQAAHPPAAALRRDVVQAVTAQPRHAPNLQWLAMAAAILLGLAVVAGLMSSRLAAQRTPVPGHQKASPVADYGPPPAGVPLLYVHDPNNPSWLIGFDWSGQPRGTVKLSPEAAQGGVRMAPDGSAFQVGSTIKGGTDIFLDRLGHPIPTNGVSTDVAGEMWADDNKHLCLVTLNQQTFAWGLSTRLPGAAARPVAVIARDPGLGQSGISLAACSFDNNRAILVRTVIAWPSELWVVRLTDGKVLSHNTYSSSRPFANVVGSGDALFVAENSSKSVGQLGSAAPSTIIRRVSDRSVVATLDPSLAVLAFNGDDSLVLVTSSPSLEPAQPALTSVIDLRSGQAVWHDQGTSVFGGVVAQPGGRDFALILNTSGSQTPGVPDPMATILIIHGDGSLTKFPRLYEPAW